MEKLAHQQTVDCFEPELYNAAGRVVQDEPQDVPRHLRMSDPGRFVVTECHGARHEPAILMEGQSKCS
jgi:hypothetical protein